MSYLIWLGHLRNMEDITNMYIGLWNPHPNEILHHRQVSHETNKWWQWGQLSKWWSRPGILGMEVGKPWSSYWAGMCCEIYFANNCEYNFTFCLKGFRHGIWWLQAVDYKRPTYEEVMRTFNSYLNENGISAKCKSAKWWT